MRMVRGIRWAALSLMVVTAGCATRGQLDRAVQEQRTALEAERAERLAGEARLQSDMTRLSGNLEALRTDLLALDAEFGAKLARLEDGLQLTVPVHFAFDAETPNPEADEVLDRFADIIRRSHPSANIVVEGFTDPAGSAAYNRRLAQRRAESVRAALIERGLLPDQLRAVGHGSAQQVVAGAAGDQVGAQLNRRVVFVIEDSGPTVLGTPVGGTATPTATAARGS